MNELNVIRTRGRTFYPRRHPSLWSVLFDKWLEGSLLQGRTDNPHSAAKRPIKFPKGWQAENLRRKGYRA